MQKVLLLKKKIIKNASIAALSGAICGGILFFAIYIIDNETSALQKTETTMRQTRMELTQIEDSLNIYERSYAAYWDLYETLRNGKYTVDAERGSKILELLSRKHRITDLRLTMSAKELFNTNVYVGFSPVYRKITINFSAMSDTHIYAFMENIQKYFSGYVHFTTVSIQQERPLDDALLAEIQSGTTLRIIKATITFLWVGIEEKKEQRKEIKNG